MNMGSMWDSFSSWIVYIGLPATGVYHLLCNSVFLNVAVEDAQGFEKAANVCFVPVQYLLAGKIAKPIFSEEGYKIGYALEQRFDYNDETMWWKTASAYCALPSSLFWGTLFKALSYLSFDARENKGKIGLSIASGGSSLRLNNEYYHSIGIDVVTIDQAETILSQGYERRPQDVNKLLAEKEALKEIASLLHAAGISYWLDCGTCLGAYRYGGSIPWDWDIDIAVLQKDSTNVAHVLSKLDPKKYAVQDWSSRDKPNTYLKVYVKETHNLIDIYHFGIDEKNQAIYSILSNGDCVFLPDSWKIRERRFTISTPFSFVFPLKKVNFDGIEAFIPNSPKEYLQLRYGENISPAKVYNPITDNYEKDLSHPYWLEPYRT